MERADYHAALRSLSNGFSRKIENHAAAIALSYFAYNFIKIHPTLRVTPAMAAGVTDHLWDASELVSLMGILRTAEAGKSGMIYVKSIVAGLVCVCVASFLTLEVISLYLSVVYHVETGPLGWNSSFLASPLNWFLTAAMFLGGFFWEFLRLRSK